MRQYISSQADRPIPVGYSSADVAENIESQALYFACGEDEWARSDFFAFNDYSWCEPSSFTESGWDQKVETYRNYGLPLFLSEFGCITNTRTWGEIEALYSQKMTVAYSGGLVYEYTVEPNGYGLVQQSGNGIVPNADFRRLKQAYSQTPNPSGNGGAQRQRNVPNCPRRTREWDVDQSSTLPEIPGRGPQYIRNGVGRGPGLGGDGSQWAGTPSDTDPDLSNGVTQSSNPGGSGTSSSDGSSASGEGAAAGVFPSMVAAMSGVAVVLAMLMS
jgi:1,3-beta-glucanosyltransferase GAS5